MPKKLIEEKLEKLVLSDKFKTSFETKQKELNRYNYKSPSKIYESMTYNDIVRSVSSQSYKSTSSSTKFYNELNSLLKEEYVSVQIRVFEQEFLAQLSDITSQKEVNFIKSVIDSMNEIDDRIMLRFFNSKYLRYQYNYGSIDELEFKDEVGFGLTPMAYRLLDYLRQEEKDMDNKSIDIGIPPSISGYGFIGHIEYDETRQKKK